MRRLPEKIGLIAGAGGTPLLLAQCASAMKVTIISILLSPDNEEEIRGLSEKSYPLGLGQTSKILRTLRDNSIQHIVLIGKINKDIIFKRKAFDLRAVGLLARMKMKDDASFKNLIIEEFRKEGIKVLNQTLFLKDYMAGAGNLGKRKPGSSELRDIKFGFPIAKKLAGMEIGQTIVVKDRSVVAVESMEGTDRAIQRGCEIAENGAVIIKVSRPNQDWRFDVPTLGLKTVRAAVRGRASTLAMESGRTLFLERDQALSLADAKRLAVCSFSAEDLAL